MGPRLCAARGSPERAQLVWRHLETETLLRFALRSGVSLTVPEVADLLTLLGKAVPRPPRKADCFQALLLAALPDWTDDQRKTLFDKFLGAPSEETRDEAELDEDVLAAIKSLPDDQKQDFDDLVAAAERVERRHRLKRRQAAGEVGVGTWNARRQPRVVLLRRGCTSETFGPGLRFVAPRRRDRSPILYVLDLRVRLAPRGVGVAPSYVPANEAVITALVFDWGPFHFYKRAPRRGVPGPVGKLRVP